MIMAPRCIPALSFSNGLRNVSATASSLSTLVYGGSGRTSLQGFSPCLPISMSDDALQKRRNNTKY